MPHYMIVVVTDGLFVSSRDGSAGSTSTLGELTREFKFQIYSSHTS